MHLQIFKTLIYLYFDIYPKLSDFLRDTENGSEAPKYNFDDSPPKGIPLWLIHLMAGGVSGPFSRTVTAPIDRIRVTMQIIPNVSTITETVEKLVREGGILGLWRGNFMNILKVTPEMSLRFAFYERIKQHIKLYEKTTVYEKMLSGAIAGVLAQCTIYPLEVIKTRMTIRKTGQYDGIIDAFKKVYQAEGVRAFYRGYCTSVVGIIPYTAIDLTVFETLKYRLIYNENYNDTTNISVFFRVILCATIATSFGQAASYPLYLVKARQQAVSRHPSNRIVKKWRFCRLCQILRTIVLTEGIPGLYRGLLPSLVKVIPASAINYGVYEYIHRKLSKRLM